jgi:hypothetical protein
MPSASGDERRQACGRRPHLSDGCGAWPGRAPGRLHQPHSAGGSPHRKTAQAALRCAPSGMPPLSRPRHRAMSNFRVTATIPMRLRRFPPPPKRSRHQPLRALSGWERTPLHANSVAIQRTCRVPDLVMPCSRALSPLWYGGGVTPAKPPTSRRFFNVRQAKHSLPNPQAPWLPMG